MFLLGTALKICWVNHPPAIQKRVKQNICLKIKNDSQNILTIFYVAEVFNKNVISNVLLMIIFV
jgi:hypothetical protein